MARRKFGYAEIDQRIVAGGKFVMRVGEQLEAETFGGAELLMSPFVLHADAEDDRVFLLVKCDVLLEIARFLGAAAGEILGIEI